MGRDGRCGRCWVTFPLQIEREREIHLHFSKNFTMMAKHARIEHAGDSAATKPTVNRLRNMMIVLNGWLGERTLLAYGVAELVSKTKTYLRVINTCSGERLQFPDGHGGRVDELEVDFDTTQKDVYDAVRKSIDPTFCFSLRKGNLLVHAPVTRCQEPLGQVRCLYVTIYPSQAHFWTKQTDLKPIVINSFQNIRVGPAGLIAKFYGCGKTDIVLQTLSESSGIEATPKTTFRGHTNSVGDAAFSPDGQLMVSGDFAGCLKLWSVPTGECLQTFHGHEHGVDMVIFSPDGRFILSGSFDTTAKLWCISSGHCLKTFQGHSDWISSVAFSPDGKTVVTGSGDCTVKLWAVDSGKCLKTFNNLSRESIAAAFSDGKIFAASHDASINIWHITEEYELITCETFTIDESHESEGLVFSPDKTCVLSVHYQDTHDHEGIVKVTSLLTGECLQTIPVDMPMTNAYFSADGLSIVVRLYQE